jgi:hypothetical protein
MVEGRRDARALPAESIGWDDGPTKVGLWIDMLPGREGEQRKRRTTGAAGPS